MLHKPTFQADRDPLPRALQASPQVLALARAPQLCCRGRDATLGTCSALHARQWSPKGGWVQLPIDEWDDRQGARARPDRIGVEPTWCGPDRYW